MTPATQTTLSRLGDIADLLICRNKHRELGKIRRQGNIFQVNEQDKTSEKELNKMEKTNLLDKELKVKVIKILTKLRKRVEKENFNKEIESIKIIYQS